MADIRINVTINQLNEGQESDLLFTYRHREQGQTTWIESTPTADKSYTVTGLNSDQAYETQVFTNNTVLNKSIESAIETITTSSSDPLEESLVAHYTMQNISGNTLIDEMGSYDGTIVGTNYDTSSGSFKTTNFDTYINVPNLGQWFANKTEFSVSAILKSGANTGVAYDVCVSNSSWSNPFYRFTISSSNSTISSYVTSYTPQLNYAGSNLDTVYSHIVITFKGGVAKLYADRILIQSMNTAESIMPNSVSSNLCFGRLPVLNDISNAAQIDIKQFKLYDKELTQEEIDSPSV